MLISECNRRRFYAGLLSDQSIFPTRGRRWVSLDDNPLIVDHDPLAALFFDAREMPLLDVPSTDGTCLIDHFHEL